MPYAAQSKSPMRAAAIPSVARIYKRCTYLQSLHVSICLDQADSGSITSKPAQQDDFHWWKGSESDGLRALDRRGTSTRPPSLESPQSSLEHSDLSCQRRNW